MADDPFVVAVDAWVDKALDRQDRIIQLAAQLALARIKELTPVRTGYLRANWLVVRGSAAEALQGASAELSQNAVLTLRAGDVFSLVNPVEYAARIQWGFVGTDSLGRHYNQAGVHMIEQVVTELPDIFAKAADIVTSES